MSSFKKTAILIGLGLALTACAKKPYEPITDGPKSASYNSDLAECRQFSQQKQADGSGGAAGAIGGGITAGVFGGSTGDVVASIALGGIFGSAEDSAKTQSLRNRIVFNCMRGRDHNVIG